MVVREGGTDYAPDADGGVPAGWLAGEPESRPGHRDANYG